MSKKDWNGWIDKKPVKQLSVKIGKITPLQFEDYGEPVTPDSEIEAGFALLKPGTWKLYNVGTGYTLDLWDNVINSGKASYIRGFYGLTVGQVLEEYREWKHAQDVKDIPGLFD